MEAGAKADAPKVEIEETTIKQNKSRTGSLERKYGHTAMMKHKICSLKFVEANSLDEAIIDINASDALPRLVYRTLENVAVLKTPVAILTYNVKNDQCTLKPEDLELNVWSLYDKHHLNQNTPWQEPYQYQH